MQKGFAPILIVILFAAVLAVGVLFYTNYSNNRTKISQNQQVTPTPSPTQDSTANWKTYNSPNVNFIFKYPSDWRVISNSERELQFGNKTYQGVGVTLRYPPIPQDLKNFTPEYIFLSGFRGEDFSSNFLDSYIKEEYKFSMIKVNIKMVGDVAVHEVQHQSCPSNNCLDLLFLIQDIIFKVDSNVDSDVKTYLETIYKIISTIKLK